MGSASSKLFEAVKTKNVEGVKEILDSKAVDPNTVEDENSNKTALHYAAALSNKSAVPTTTSTKTETKTDENKKKESDEAEQQQDKGLAGYKITKMLVEAGWNVNHLSRGGGSPLHIAAANGHTDTIRYLISKGADVFALTSTGLAPIHSACFASVAVSANSSSAFADEPIRLLLEAGRKVRAERQREFDRDSSNKPADHQQTNNFVPLPMAQLLTNTGESALHLACKSGNLGA